MLNIDGLIIIHININDQINNGLYMSCYPITNWVVFEFVNFDTVIIRVVFGLTSIVEYLSIDMTRTGHEDTNCHP